uniref:Chemokine interleukin-8-like domain-containing protein n=1 Tax=Nothobranchius korthausae TaxID=1143690 RepID=A0A1A8GAH8_9TELE
MAFFQRNVALLLVVVAAVCIELHQGQYVPGRCKCPQVQRVYRINVSDFEVIEKSPTCDKTQVILTSVKPDNSTEQICVDPLAKIAQGFLRCWNRIQKDTSRRMECIERRRRAETKSSDD